MASEQKVHRRSHFQQNLSAVVLALLQLLVVFVLIVQHAVVREMVVSSPMPSSRRSETLREGLVYLLVYFCVRVILEKLGISASACRTHKAQHTSQSTFGLSTFGVPRSWNSG